MYERLDQALQMHKMCLKELSQLQINVESYLQASTGLSELLQAHWYEVCQGNNLALMVYDNFLTSITNIMNSARKFNIQIQLNNLNATEKSNVVASLEDLQESNIGKLDCHKSMKACSIVNVKSSNNKKHATDTLQALYPAEEFAENLEYMEEFTYPKINLMDYYTKNAIIKASVTYIKDLNNLEFSILDTSSQLCSKILEMAQSIELHQYHSIPPVRDIFGLALDKCIFRAVRGFKVLYDQEADEEYWPCYLLDFGEVVPLKTQDITYKLTEEHKTLPALAISCHFKNPDRNPFLLQSQLQDKLKNLVYQNCKLKVISVEENSLQVELVEDEPGEKNGAINKATNPFKNLKKSAQKKLTDEELEMLYEEPASTSNAMKAVMGYDPQDDKRICRFYDPTTGGCFKGPHCKLEHVPRQPDGWTKDVLPAATIVDNRSPLVIYPTGTKMNILPTYIGEFERFYAQINDPHQSTTPLIWNDEEVPNWKLLQKPPHIFELVLSRYEDGLWYRAKILSHNDDYKMFKVFYVDYGNHQIVHLRNLAQIDYSMAQLPFQAVLCRIAGVKEVQNIPADKRKEGLKMLCEMILNKSIDVKVVSHYEDLLLSFVNKKDCLIPKKLIDMGYMKPFKS